MCILRFDQTKFNIYFLVIFFLEMARQPDGGDARGLHDHGARELWRRALQWRRCTSVVVAAVARGANAPMVAALGWEGEGGVLGGN
jgi:hypothetical protein